MCLRVWSPDLSMCVDNGRHEELATALQCLRFSKCLQDIVFPPTEWLYCWSLYSSCLGRDSEWWEISHWFWELEFIRCLASSAAVSLGKSQPSFSLLSLAQSKHRLSVLVDAEGLISYAWCQALELQPVFESLDYVSDSKSLCYSSAFYPFQYWTCRSHYQSWWFRSPLSSRSDSSSEVLQSSLNSLGWHSFLKELLHFLIYDA